MSHHPQSAQGSDISETIAELRRPVIGLRLGTPLILPQGYGCVVMTGLASVMLVSWKSMKVSSARRDLQVPNPLTYSDKCMAFNCVYRYVYLTAHLI